MWMLTGVNVPHLILKSKRKPVQIGTLRQKSDANLLKNIIARLLKVRLLAKMKKRRKPKKMLRKTKRLQNFGSSANLRP
jgi:hypothetical protein